MLNRLQKLQANRSQLASGGELTKACKTDSVLRHEIEVLAKHYLSKSVSGCSNCYFDAYFELINLNLEKAMSKDTCNFKLRAGALLHDVVNFDNDLLCSNANLTNDLALYHLKTNPNAKKFFEKLPDDVDKLVEAYSIECKKSKVKTTKAKSNEAPKADTTETDSAKVENQNSPDQAD